MRTIAKQRPCGNRGFRRIADAFLAGDGLPFADVLSADRIERSFDEHDNLFGMDDIYSTPRVLWAFLGQVLSDGKEASCESAVAQITVSRLQEGLEPPTADTGDYCRARAKLSELALRQLVVETADELQSRADESWLWKGRHAKLIDGFTFTMADTEENQSEYPQAKTQRPGVGLPIARVCAILSLATACVTDLAVGPYKGKEASEVALFRQLLDSLDQRDLVVADRYYCSFMMLAMLMSRGVDACIRMHQRRHVDFRRGKRLGREDHLIEWHKPQQRPKWMDKSTYASMPEVITLREVRVEISGQGRRSHWITIATTLLDPAEYSKRDLAELYGFRWNVELDIRSIKTTLGLEHVNCKSPAMVRRHLWTTLLAYNLIRTITARTSLMYGGQPREMSFTSACQYVLSTWMLVSTGHCIAETIRLLYKQIAACRVGNRLGREEPRVKKRRPKSYPLMQLPRAELKAKLRK